MINSSRSFMQNAIRRSLIRTQLFLLFALILLSGCAHAKPYFFNDSDKVITDDAGKGVCAQNGYPCVNISQGLYRTITTVNPTVKIIYVKIQENGQNKAAP